jgi:hypothetical protein
MPGGVPGNTAALRRYSGAHARAGARTLLEDTEPSTMKGRPMATPRKVRIGEMLLGAGLISEQQLSQALEEQKRSGRRLGRVLIESGLIEETRLARLLAEQLGIELIDLRSLTIDASVAPAAERHARRYRALVLAAIPTRALRLGNRPTDLTAYDFTRALRCEIELCALAESQLLESAGPHLPERRRAGRPGAQAEGRPRPRHHDAGAARQQRPRRHNAGGPAAGRRVRGRG